VAGFRGDPTAPGTSTFEPGSVLCCVMLTKSVAGFALLCCVQVFRKVTNSRLVGGSRAQIATRAVVDQEPLITANSEYALSCSARPVGHRWGDFLRRQDMVYLACVKVPPVVFAGSAAVYRSAVFEPQSASTPVLDGPRVWSSQDSWATALSGSGSLLWPTSISGAMAQELFLPAARQLLKHPCPRSASCNRSSGRSSAPEWWRTAGSSSHRSQRCTRASSSASVSDPRRPSCQFDAARSAASTCFEAWGFRCSHRPARGPLGAFQV